MSITLYNYSCNLYCMTTLAERLLEAIDATGIGPDALSKAIGVSRQSVYAWKRGEGIGQMKASNLVALAELSEIDPVWILKGVGQKRRGLDLTEEEVSLLKLFRACDVRGRMSIMRTAEQEHEYSLHEHTGNDRRKNGGQGYFGKDRRRSH